MSFQLRPFNSTTPATSPKSTPDIPLEPTSIAETKLGMGFLTDLVLKIIYFYGNITAQQLAEVTKLPFLGVIDKVLEFLKLEEYVDIIGTQGGFSERSFQYIIATKGRSKVIEVLDRSQYAGPAPVPLDDYIDIVLRQSVTDMVANTDTVRQAFGHLVINDTMLDKIGPAANSARSLFLYGPPGNGKTTIAEGIANMLGGLVLIPYAVEIDGQIIKMFDPLNHKVVEMPSEPDPEPEPTFGEPERSGPRTTDRRWVVCKRPQVVVGGELIMEQLELIFDPISKVYEAPYQLKANGGLFLIDDFGRQKCRPQDLLNRWIVPLEKKVDFLALQTGKKIQVPFDVLIVFSTNLSPSDLVDDAFLRRIRHKIEVPNPSPDEYRDIFRIVSKAKKIPYSDEGLRYLIHEHYFKKQRDLRSCHPRDLCDQILDEAKYRGTQPAMTRELIDRACEAYFVKLA
ncbi:MAG: AAA family ATPase [Chloroflexi bacterium AL-W]|nr:AAA family ATPase [Chloroflexi bacterium AL-N1]NOK67620.1 AAA family ATPase [Chloroflexi bacterium AL-N10]NOK75610.1 AAA family ATPase [Chloroflexi bacterium AL-N5]NOK82398.1 AAA family ATPase [Chloroflexi bacterium AL-W]NOK90243.1 AAA family ATPase [Chloroflexi bacterium AL-N15]